MSATCQGQRKDGTACKMPPLPNDAACWAHSPATAQRRAAARQAGGRGHGRGVRAVRFLSALPIEYRELLDKLLELMQAVEAGEIKARDAEVIGGLSGRVLDWVRFAVDLRDRDDIERRLDDLEAQLGRRSA